MTSIKQIPAGIFNALGIHKGDFLRVRDESPLAFVIEVTSASQPSSKDEHRQAALARFASGAHVPGRESEAEREDARFEYLRCKHLK
jgi:hypothetical protein